MDDVRAAGNEPWKVLINIDFVLDGKFCDKDELKSSLLDSWRTAVFHCRLIQHKKS